MNNIDCPRAKTWMTPCIARDGATALADAPELDCFGCGIDPCAALKDLAERYAPARRYLQTKDPVRAADRLTQLVAEYTS